MPKKHKKKISLSWDLVWNNYLSAFIITSVANSIKSAVIYQDEDTDIRDLLWQLFLFYYGRNKTLIKEDLVYIVPSRVLTSLIDCLYGPIELCEEMENKLKAFLGIEVIDVGYLNHTVLLINKRWSNVVLDCEFIGNRLEMNVNPRFEHRWSKAVLYRG